MSPTPRITRPPCRPRTILIRRVFVCALVIAAAAGVISESAWAQARQKQVLVLYAVRRDAQIAVVGDRELPRLLQAGLPEGVDYYSEFLDVARVSETDYQDAFRDFLDLKYRAHRFDMVIAMGDAPLAFLAQHRTSLFPATPVVFFSTQSAPVRLPDSTGLSSPLELAATLDLASRLQPDLRQVFVVSGATGNSTELAARAQLARFAPRIELTYLTGLSSAEIESRIRALPPRSAVYYLVVDRDANNQNFHPLEYLDRVASLAAAPVYSWVDSAIGHGIVGGSLKNQTLQVRMLGELAVRVLRGEAAERIAVEAADLNRAEVDWRQLRRWGLDEGRLPPGTQIHFREPSVWERYRIYILGAVSLLLAQSVLIGALLVQRTRRRHAERRVLEGQDALRASYQRIRDLGRRLLQAQDSERARVARELHDDISQQLALLEIDLELVGRRADVPGVMTEALTRARSVARSVHELSHRLHPAKLRLIGLVSALKGVQHELSQAGVSIAFTDENIPPSLPPAVTLCVFRVAQEALQNAVRHSGARNITMRLHATPEHLSLTVADDGAGFDVGSVRGRGLGLLSMEERVEAAGGSFELRSEPGLGTHVSVTVPIHGEAFDSPNRGRTALLAEQP